MDTKTTDATKKITVIKYFAISAIMFGLGVVAGTFKVVPYLITPKILPVSSLVTSGISTKIIEKEKNIQNLYESLRGTGFVSGVVSEVNNSSVVIRTQTFEQITNDTFSEYRIFITSGTKISKLSLKDPKASVMDMGTSTRQENILLKTPIPKGFISLSPAVVSDITEGSVVAVSVKENPQVIGEFLASEIQFQSKPETSTPVTE